MKANKLQFDSGVDEKKCSWEGCSAHGEYPAPKSRDNLNERYYFCLGHIKEYNKSWDFFKGMSQEEIQAFQIDSITGHRKTARRDANHRNFSEEDLREELFREFDFFGEAQKRKEQVPSGEMKYMNILGLKHPVTMKEIKAKYKELAKKYHPDVQGDGDEEKFKQVSEAYNFLKNCGIQ